MTRTGAGLLLAVALTLSAACGGGDDQGLGEIKRLSGEEHFSNGREAAGALATVGDRAIKLQRACLRDAGPKGDRRACGAYGVLAAWAQVSAVAVAKCSRAGAAEARADLVRLIDDVEASIEETSEDGPGVPPTPSCR